MENSLTKGNVWRKLLLFAVPIFSANLLQALYGTVDLLIVGNLPMQQRSLRSYSVDCCIVSINFAMMGYLNGCGRTGFVALQGILSTFLVRIPVSYFMSKIPGVSLFQVGFATPLATVFAIIITMIYMKRIKK